MKQKNLIILILSLSLASSLSSETIDDVKDAVNEFKTAAEYMETNATGTNKLTIYFDAKRLPGSRNCSGTLVISRKSINPDGRLAFLDSWEIDLDQKGKRLAAKMENGRLSISTPASGILIRATSQVENGNPSVRTKNSIEIPGFNWQSRALEIPLKALATNLSAIRYCQSQAG